MKEIVSSDYQVVTLLPSGATPESYSPTARQIAALSDAEFVFSVGMLTFEQELMQRVGNKGVANVVNVNKGIELIAGGCNHDHSEAHSHHHHHSVDPHIWMSPRGLVQIVDNIAQALMVKHPDSVHYKANSESLMAKLTGRAEAYGEVLKSAPKEFLIYHPALGYFAHEYGLEQIALENEGKNPTPNALAKIVDKVQAEGIEELLYQQEYPLDVVKPIAEILGVNLVEINPLCADIIAELDRIVAQLTNRNE
ncbi:MAG: zinc ABC transporter substrate-binding protein [Tidjanibacter sp.]|nr:zinc ABC transporter substrate-binding protein [Tidjanibacter sp.]